MTDRRATGMSPSKHTGCPATLQVIVKRFIKNSKSKKQDNLTKDFPTIIIMKNQHNHSLNIAAVLKYRDLSTEIVEKFLLLFRQGHSPSSALHCHKMDLMLEHGEDYYKIAADGKYLPSISIVAHIFEKQFASEYGKMNGEEMLSNLNDMLKEYMENMKGIAKADYTSDKKHYYVVLLTPIMIRAHEKIIQSSEVMMVDAAGGVDKQRHRIYLFITPCAAGGIPLGIIITDSEEQSVFLEALKCFKNLLPSSAFYRNHYPKIIITDNDLKEINALNEVFPASIKLLCHFHFLKAFWAWLLNPNHKINTMHRQELYFLFCDILYSTNDLSAKENLNVFVSCALKYKYNNVIIHCTKLMKFKEKWLMLYRNTLQLRGNNTTNYIEIVFRIIKDYIFDRTMAFNLTQLVDYILTRYEMYMHQRLIDFSHGRYKASLLKKMLPFKVNLRDFKINSLKEHVYTVKEINKLNTYKVDISQGICSCNVGCSGRLCKHSSAILLELDKSINSAYNIVSTKIKQIIFYVANGKIVNEEWFNSLQDNENTSKNLCVFDENDKIELENHNYTDTESITNQSNITNSTNDFNEVKKFSSEEYKQLENLFSRIREGIESGSEIFIPAARKMLQNASKFAATDNGLISAMYTFGSYCRVKSVKQIAARSILRRCHKSRIGVQPTAIGRRKACLSGKRKLNAGRPSGQTTVKNNSLQTHNYTTFGYIPKRKRKAPHNLQQCVYDNKALAK